MRDTELTANPTGWLRATGAMAGQLLLCGCLSIGPQTIVKDRFKYNEAIRDSWEEQMLSNMVAIRYGESPVFLNVSSVIAQYGLETSAQLQGGLNTGLTGSDTAQAGTNATWTERPTITYLPVQGTEFTANLLTPVAPAELFGLIEAGWNAARSLRLLLKSINGVAAYDQTTRRLNPDFYEVLDAFKSLQDEEALGIRHVQEEGRVRTFLYLRDVASNPTIERALEVIVEKLRLSTEGEGVEVVFGPYYQSADTISVHTMSIMDILNESAAYIQAPEVHVAQGRTQPNRITDHEVYRPLLRILSAEKEPEDALVAIRRRDHWYYIDDTDFESKKTFSFLMIVMQLSAAQEKSQGPVVTIGAGN